MIASLPMYWRAETAEIWQKLWASAQTFGARYGLALPDLTTPEDLAGPWVGHWTHPDLVLSQTCGLPFRSSLRDRVTYVGTFDFGLTCAPGYYYSYRIEGAASADRTARLAFNADDSQSGWAAAEPVVRRFADHIETGSHRASWQAVAEGRADIAYIDAVTWRLLERYDNAAARVSRGGATTATPGLPLITALGRDPVPLRDAVRAAIAELTPGEKEALGGLRDLVEIPVAAYHAVPVPPRLSELHGACS